MKQLIQAQLLLLGWEWKYPQQRASDDLYKGEDWMVLKDPKRLSTSSTAISFHFEEPIGNSPNALFFEMAWANGKKSINTPLNIYMNKLGKHRMVINAPMDKAMRAAAFVTRLAYAKNRGRFAWVR